MQAWELKEGCIWSVSNPDSARVGKPPEETLGLALRSQPRCTIATAWGGLSELCLGGRERNYPQMNVRCRRSWLLASRKPYKPIRKNNLLPFPQHGLS